MTVLNCASAGQKMHVRACARKSHAWEGVSPGTRWLQLGCGEACRLELQALLCCGALLQACLRGMRMSMSVDITGITYPPSSSMMSDRP